MPNTQHRATDETGDPELNDRLKELRDGYGGIAGQSDSSMSLPDRLFETIFGKYAKAKKNAERDAAFNDSLKDPK